MGPRGEGAKGRRGEGARSRGREGEGPRVCLTEEGWGEGAKGRGGEGARAAGAGRLRGAWWRGAASHRVAPRE